MWTDRGRRRVISWIIAELFEELIYRDILSAKEVNRLYLTLGNQCGLFDLLPRNLPPDPKQLLQGLTERRAKMATTPGAHQAVIFHRKEGVAPPDEYLKKVVSQFDTANGQSLVDGGKLETLTDDKEQNLNLDGLKQVLSEYKQESVFFFGKASKAYTKEDVQPFVLISKDKEPQIAVYLVGELNDEYDHESKAHSTAYYIAHEYIKDKLLDMWENLSENLDNMVTAMGKPRFRDDLIKSCIGEGTILFHFANGNILQISKNPKAMGFDNGNWWTSDTLGYTEEAVGKVPPSDAKPLSALERRRQLLATGTSAPTTTAAAAVPTSSDKATGPKIPESASSESAPVTVLEDGLVKCPYTFAKDPKARRSWFYRNFKLEKDKDGNAKLPENWQTIPGLPPEQLKADSKLKDRIKSMDKLGVVKESVSKAVHETRPPWLIGEQERTAVRKLLEPYGLESASLLTFEQLDQAHNQMATFSEQLGYPLELALLLPDTVFNQLVRTYPHAANALLASARHLITTELREEMQIELTEMRKEAKDKERISKGDQKRVAM